MEVELPMRFRRHNTRTAHRATFWAQKWRRQCHAMRLQPTPSEGRQRWHYDTLSSPHLPPPALVLSDDCGPPGAVGGWAPPPLPQGPQDLPRNYGPDGAAGGLSRSTPRRADDTTTRPSGAGRRVSLTTGTRSQATCYVRRGMGRVVLFATIIF